MNSTFITPPLPRRLVGAACRQVAGMALLAACSALVPVAVLAQPASGPTFVIKGFDVTGDNPLSSSEVTQILAPYLRTDATIETLQKATVALENALKAKGFALHKVVLPPQEIGQSVALNIVKFVIGKVTVEGNSRLSEKNIRASVPELKEGTATNFNTLSVQTTIANESQGKHVQVSLKESDEPDRIDARIVVKEAQPWNFAISASNTGSPATGEDRITLAGGHSNLFDLDHQITLAYTTSAAHTKDVKQVGLNYRVPFYAQGGVLGLSYTQSDVVGNFGTFNSTGAGRTAGLNYNSYLVPRGGYRGYIAVGLDDKQFDVTLIDGNPMPGQLVRRSMPFTLGYNARVESDSSVWGYNTEIAVNLPGGSGNDLDSYKSEDTRIDTVRWAAVRGGGNYTSAWPGGWLWGLRGQFQYSNVALISGEQFGVGGSSSVRGTGERPLSGDSGAFVSTEITTPELTSGLRLLAFADAGWLRNNNVSGTAKLETDNLSSAGVGLRYALPKVVFSVDYGRIIGGSGMPVTANSNVPQAGDFKFHVNLSARF